MKNESMIVQLNADLCNTIQYLYYMTDAYKEVLQDLIDNKRCIDANKELLDYYNNEYIHYNVQLKTIKEEAIHALCDIPEDKQAIYYIDFVRQCIVITDMKDIK